MTLGIVIGKFHPPHRGHSFLISAALKQSDEVVVIICERNDQSIPGKLRAGWLKEMHPQADVMVIDDPGRDTDTVFWAKHTVEVLGRTPDIVFSSEEYGVRYAELMGCQHVMVDLNRLSVPISATEIRQDPLQHWEHLPAPIRAYYAKRICVLGAESTGTTTISRLLADHYRTVWVSEYGRDYSEARIVARGENAPWRSGEFTHIAQQQQFYEDMLARQCNRILFCDTDAVATGVWHERYVDARSVEVDKLIANRNYDYYFLTNTDCPYEEEPLRDGRHLREWMNQRFTDELNRLNRPFTLLSGGIEERMKSATDVVDKILGRNVKKPLW
jgi:HTH-type transcriptional repressor of NAD biosynthesis genes